MSTLQFINPSEYTQDTGAVAQLTLEDAKQLQYLVSTQQDRISQIEKWLKEDEKRGIFYEDHGED